MSGVLSQVFGAGNNNKPIEKSLHTVFIETQLVPLLQKIQRELVWRRFAAAKECQTPLQEAILACHEFAETDWNPNNHKDGSAKVTTTAPTTTTDHTSVTAADTDEEEEETVVDDDGASATTTATVDYVHHHDSSSSSPTMILNNNNNVAPAIEKTIDALRRVVRHGLPHKQYKACELALDGICLVVEHRYLSGRAAGTTATAASTTTHHNNTTAKIATTTNGHGATTSSSTSNGGGTTAAGPSDLDPAAPASAAMDNDSSHKLQAPTTTATTGSNNTNNSSSGMILQQLIEDVAKCADCTHETMQLHCIKTLHLIMTSPHIAVHDHVMLTALRGIFHVYLVTKQAKPQAKSAVLDILRSVFMRMEAHEALLQKTTTTTSTNTTTPTTGPDRNNGHHHGHTTTTTTTTGFASQFHADAYYLFRSLCKLSSKELQADTVDESTKRLFQSLIPTDPTELNSKLLALELIVHALSDGYCGEAFLGEKFVYLVQHYLSGSLLKNCVSNHTKVAFLSQRIFLILLYKFKDYLKQDIEIFMSNVFFRVLESPNSSFKQKALVLESLRSLCRDPVLLTQIFLNYDCDFDGMNLYKDIVHTLTKLGGRATTGGGMKRGTAEADETAELSLAALECLVAILRAFLKALSLNAGGEEASTDSAGARIRSLLQLDAALLDVNTTTDGPTAGSSSAAMAMADVESVLSEETSGTATNNVAEKIVNAFDRKQMAQQNFEIGAVKFTLSLKTGLRFFIDNGFVDCDANAIALFFLEHQDKLDKTQMGEALGREPDANFVKGDHIDPDKGGSGFWVRILHYYINALNFTDLMFDDAIRLFLAGFRLPGEAQKIDRIMEKFAERFTAQNPAVFPSADTAFILAFSVIMLNTDLHNPSIKPERRMTLDSFLRNNRGIGDNGSDLPVEFLTGIYNRIKERPFTLKEDDAVRERIGGQKQQLFDAPVFFDGSSTLFGSSAEERRREQFKKERDEMMAATEQLVRRRQGKAQLAAGLDETKIRETIPPSEVVKPMFDVTWGPMLGILSQVMECADDDRSTAVCLNGFVFAIRLAAHSDMSLARDTFVTSLAKFTYLGSIKEMKRKNVESIRTLLIVAVVDGEYLGESFGPVLQCMSQMAKLRLSASGLESDESFLVNESPLKAPAPAKQELINQHGRTSIRVELAKEAEENNGKAVLEAVQEVLIDKVFSATVNLSATSLALFVQQLIIVASSEINGSGSTGPAMPTSTMDISGNSSGPSIFSLQRLVEVADFNMDVRPRLVWSQVWGYMADFFVDLACHQNEMVSVFAIDSLKQLSLKFLEKPELSEFNFQSSFLKPFLVVMQQKGSREGVRELVLQCVDIVIRAKAHNLRSGWKIIFSILTISARDKSEKIEYLGLSILQRLLDDHLEAVGCLRYGKEETSDGERKQAEGRIRNALADDFVHLCKASLSFVQYEAADSLRPFGLTMRAICHIAIYADLVASQRVLPPISGAQNIDPDEPGYTYGADLTDKEKLELVLWRPLFEGLGCGIKSSARTSSSGIGCLVQRGSVLAIRAILLRHGHLFSTPQLFVILNETVIPAIKSAAEKENSPILNILSERPSMSTFDFITSPLPLPPDSEHPKLLEFREHNMTKKREVGPAELMLEASFTDLRHGGDGDLRKAASLAQKSSEEKATEQPPFPDSWIAITAPVALGLLTDVCSEFVLYRGQEGRDCLWPLVAQQFKLWCIGQHEDAHGEWKPCEALVRIACREVFRLPYRMFADTEFSDLPTSEQEAWVMVFLETLTAILNESVSLESGLKQRLLDAKEQMNSIQLTDDLDADDVAAKIAVPPYGHGILVRSYQNPQSKLMTQIVALDSGGLLFRPLQTESETSDASDRSAIPGAGIPYEVDVPDAYWVSIVPLLKIRCVAAHCLQQELDSVLGMLLRCGRDSMGAVLACLDNSRRLAADALKDDTISMAFRESLLKDWGDGIQTPDESTEATARLALLHGSDVFFLTQEAGATKAYIHLSTALQGSSSTDPAFLDFMVSVLDSYIASEAKIRPDRPSRAALYCNTFASTVVDILKKGMIVADAPSTLFPRLCALVQSDNPGIRECVQDVLLQQVAPMIGVTIPRGMAFRRVS